MYQLQTHSHRSRLQWISSLKKAIDNSGEEVDFATNFVTLKLSLYLLVRGRPKIAHSHTHPTPIHDYVIYERPLISSKERGTSSDRHCRGEA